MPHFYPKHLPDFSYLGRYSYALEFTVEGRAPHLAPQAAIDLVMEQLRRAATEERFALALCCLMPDHTHLVIDGLRDDSNAKRFIKAAKQYSGFYFKQQFGRRLWQRFGYERVIRDDMERALTGRYLLANPVRAKLCGKPQEFDGLRSDLHSIRELMLLSEYSETYLLE